MKDFGPIIRALLRNKTGAMLIALQIAITMTIMVNAIHMIINRSELMARSSGLDEANQFVVAQYGYRDDFNEKYVVQTDLDHIRNMPGVVDAIQTNSVPMSNGGTSMGLQVEPGADKEGLGVAIYMADDHALNTYGVKLIAGENFDPTEVEFRDGNTREWPQRAIISKAMAEALFPDLSPQQVVNKTVYINRNEPITIAGIIDQLQAPWVGWDNVERTMITPIRTMYKFSRYLVRTEPGRRDEVLEAVKSYLESRDVGRMLFPIETISDVREQSYRDANAMQTILWVIISILLIVTALGIVGLVTFTINRRRRQIGTRRALGASRGDILKYFLLENFVITSAGLLLGIIGSIGLNIWLVDAFDLPRIGWIYLPVAMVVLWLVGQLAVYGPAAKASRISPAIATRNV
ncbi:cell division protein FtsX [Idiomarina tyrosinivorans]|uniref:Cell division protein FtsX n=1 Tax=Idiomarina tyrosinivorans TaxID=1445662 RepID=A0A432ZSK5_9GAMM|nr:FtsX-like permease family protein [Idiomarina tyrosinivorans]RUO80842.1 cell division protein FtsX [Idiomarina tyrosinivorans]